MLQMMRNAGATSDEMANVERYKQKKLDDLLKDQLASLNDFRSALNGDGSGVTAINRLMSAQSSFAEYQAKIASGQNIDQDAFTSLGQEIFGLARDVYGTATSEFQTIRQSLLDAANGAITNTTNTVQDSTSQAIQQQTDTIVQQQVIQTDILRQIASSLIGGGASYGSAAGSSSNGRLSYNSIV
jgi:hypothetical protein